jgi:hypothetical protein
MHFDPLDNKIVFKTLNAVKPKSVIEPPAKPTCCQCNSGIDRSTFNFSLKKYKFPLCEDCQIWLVGKIFHTTKETLQLYFALKNKGLPVKLEKHVKYKKAEIIIQEANLHVEVDQTHQHGNLAQALQDLYSNQNEWQDSVLTLKVPEALVKFNMEQTSDLIEKCVMENLSSSKSIFRKAQPGSQVSRGNAPSS